MQEGIRCKLSYNSRLSWVSLGAGLAGGRREGITQSSEHCNVTVGYISALSPESERLPGGVI